LSLGLHRAWDIDHFDRFGKFWRGHGGGLRWLFT
jgi:hypothetical protein